VVTFFKEREPRYAKVRERLAAASAPSVAPASSTVTSGDEATSGAVSSAVSKGAPAPAAPRTYSGDIPPRPRKKGKKR
jgi:hypothetical protein